MLFSAFGIEEAGEIEITYLEMFNIFNKVEGIQKQIQEQDNANTPPRHKHIRLPDYLSSPEEQPLPDREAVFKQSEEEADKKDNDESDFELPLSDTS